MTIVTQTVHVTWSCGHELNLVNADNMPPSCQLCYPLVRTRLVDVYWKKSWLCKLGFHDWTLGAHETSCGYHVVGWYCQRPGCDHR